MTFSPTITENVRRVLRNLGLAEALTITHADADCVWAWPAHDGLLRHVVLDEWYQDVRRVAESYHGSRVSFREPGGVRPALQVVFHRAEDGPWPYFVELDLDESAPSGVLGKIRHGWEVLRNAVTRDTTDQQRIAELLDRRFQRA